ncbi:hypothetical protein F8S13_03410 [Chloroflexia bacterium SDU3-3]|nr:hypothetical protein F8S13_03410 [Chloroflexia bacterium SDU3-3]
MALAAYGQPTSEIFVDAPAGQARLPVYASIAYQRLYPGVSIVYGGDTSSLSSTIFINPGADPAQICWAYPDAESVAVDPATGDLLIRLPPSAAAEIRERRPLAWQEGASGAGDVAVAYTVAADGTIGLSLGAYDHAERLFISQSLQMGGPSTAGAATPAPRPAQAPAGGCGGPRPTADTLTPSAVPTYDWQLAEMELDAGSTPTLRPADATARAERNSNRTAVAQNQATTRAITPRAIDNASSRRRVYTPLPTIPSPDGVVQCELVQTDIHVLMGSCFRKTQGERRITIGAGIQVTLSDDRHDDLGIIIIYETDKPYKVYRLPENEGNLTITAATWPHITVRSAIGKEHGFNAETLEWETPQATPTTPTPTGMPTP